MRAFFALQIADVVTTMVFLSMGLAETNPLTSFFIEHLGAFGGLLVLKALAIAIALSCKMTSHPVFVRRINIFYVIVVLMNVLTICNKIRA